MCGIAGWVDFERDLSRERAIGVMMTAAVAPRGPDAEGLWVSRQAILGHRRVPVMDPAGGIQPMIAERDGRLQAVLAYTGEVYNFRELREELRARGHRFRTTGDTEVVLNAYLEWGVESVQRLDGMFAFAVWDERRQELLLARDRIGNKPLMYRPTPHGVLFGSEPKALLVHPWVSSEVDADGLREVLSQAGTPGQAIFSQMRELPPGHVAWVRRGAGITGHRYWTLPAYEHTDDAPATVSKIRELLEDSVTRQLVADQPLCALLSGGIDSSTIAALAANALRRQGAAPLRTFTVTFDSYTENFQPDAVRGTPDAPYVADVVQRIQSQHTDIVLDTADLIEPIYRAATLRAKDLPTFFGDRNTSSYLLYRAVREHAIVALSGELADEIFGGFKWMHDPELVAADTFPWIAMADRRGGAKSGAGTGLRSKTTGSRCRRGAPSC